LNPERPPGSVDLDRLVIDATRTVPGDLVALAYSSRRDRRLRALAVVEGFRGGFTRRIERTDGWNTDLLVVDMTFFESDIRESALLEIGASILLIPHRALLGEEYLARCEGEYRKKKVYDSVKALVLDHPELARELVIDERYFLHDVAQKASRIVPEDGDALLEDCVDGLMEGYRAALRDLEGEGVVRYVGSGLVAIDPGFIDSASKRGVIPLAPLMDTQRQVSRLAGLGLKGLTELIQPLLGPQVWGPAPRRFDQLNADQFLLFPTAAGLASLSGTTRLEEALGKLFPSAKIGGMSTERMGGTLNEVYLLSGGDETGWRAVLKRFPTWVDLKWAPLALWTLGTQNFAVQGRMRMERECATTSLLGREGVAVPEILYTNFRERLLLKEYIEGEDMVGSLRSAFRRGGPDEAESRLFREAGEVVATVHGIGHTLGDCKPENFIVAANGLHVVDLEQGARGGDRAWDLAEFLLFSGHFVGLLDSLSGVSEFARSFLEGYIDGGGDRRHVAEASKLKYTRVFVPLTLPQVIYTVAKVCKEMGAG
jgi:tRNA A-37 threonylcarbamoyl transferase component Bud32